MPFVQKDSDMENVPVVVKIEENAFGSVPMNPNVLWVSADHLLFMAMNYSDVTISHPSNAVVYRVRKDGAFLAIEEYPIKFFGPKEKRL